MGNVVVMQLSDGKSVHIDDRPVPFEKVILHDGVPNELATSD